MAKRKKKGHPLFKTATFAAAALGAYYLYGTKHSEAHRKKAKSWMLKAKGEVLEALEQLEQVDERNYNKVVEKVTNKYKKLKHVNNTELAVLGKELKAHWREFQREVAAGPKKKPVKRKPAKKKTTRKK